MWRTTTIAILLASAWTSSAAASPDTAPRVKIIEIEPTVLFPKAGSGEPLRQIARLRLENSGPVVEAQARIALEGRPARTEPLGSVPRGASTKEIQIDDVTRPTKLAIELRGKGDSRPIAARRLTWQPQKKWKIFCVSFSHQDLGFGDYPHRLRTNIRHGNIERLLEFCRKTDDWDDDSKFRFMIETSEPITSFLSSHGEATANELARRLRQGRIQIGALHSTVNTEQLGHECLARLFYLANRHTPDLLGAPAGRTAQNDDVIGLTWPLATFCKEADVPYCFHGYNVCACCTQPANAEPVFFWQGPGGRPGNRVLVRSVPYATSFDSIGDAKAAAIEKLIARFAAKGWPYDALLSQDGSDFTLLEMGNANKIHDWNADWSYPRLICATMDMFFDAVADQADPIAIKTFAKDGNNQWAEQDATDAWLLGEARKCGEAIPTAEKFATIAAALTPGGYPWTDVYQAYHRLLTYHEHTNAISSVGPERQRMQRYETELAENREMVCEARDFAASALDGALDRLCAAIATESERTLVVFNPSAHPRTDIVRIKRRPQDGMVIEEIAGSRVVPCQLVDGEVLMLAAEVPPMGYRTYRILPNSSSVARPKQDDKPILENRFYRIELDAATGTIASIRDKQLGVELVDRKAPHKFNEYLYERFEKPASATWSGAAAAELDIARGPVADVATVRSKPAGVRSLRQSVILYRDVKRIDFAIEMDKSPSGRTCRMSPRDKRHREAVYLALPLTVPQYEFHHELPGCVARPVLDLFGGACTAYYAVRHFSDVSNARYGVTLSPVESSLVEYGRPRCDLMTGPWPSEGKFEKEMTYPANSRMYLYLMNNMFDCNIRWDQRGPVRFHYSLRSHAGGWQEGKASQFGWEVHNPLIARVIRGKQPGFLPAAGHGFVAIDRANVVCTTIKPAEANGRGFIFRFVETEGKATTATVSAPFVGRIALANETNLVESDRPMALEVKNGRKVVFSIPAFGVKTIRVLVAPAAAPVADLRAEAVADMEVSLAWRVDESSANSIGHFNVYRGTKADFQPTLLNLVARPPKTTYLDRPALNHGGWINNRLEPGVTYYYRVAAVDRWNNRGPLSPAVKATTLPSSEKNVPPLPVEQLRAVRVSDLADYGYLNLLWRSNCEADIVRYEVHRGTRPGFTPNESNRVGTVDVDTVLPGVRAYGRVPVDHHLGDYDHQMFADENVEPVKTYYYRVCAVDAAGQRGPFSAEVSIQTKDLFFRTSAQSAFAPRYGPDYAVDGDPDPLRAWVSKPYGGGTEEEPLDVWWAIEFFKKPITIEGVKIIGDRRETIPPQKSLLVQAREAGEWKTVGECKAAAGKDITVKFIEPITTGALRVFVPAADLPRSDKPNLDSIVRIAECLAIVPGGREQVLIEPTSR